MPKLKANHYQTEQKKQKYVPPKNYAMIYQKKNWSWNGTETGVSFIIHLMNKTLKDIYAGCWCFLFKINDKEEKKTHPNWVTITKKN